MKRDEILDNLQKTSMVIKESEELMAEYKKCTHIWSYKEVNLLFKGIVLLIIWVVIFNILQYIDYTTSFFDKIFDKSEGWANLFMGFLIFVLPYLIMRFIFSFVCALHNLFKLNKYHNRIGEIEKRVNQNMNRLKESILPEAYWYSFAVDKIIEYIKNLRADNLKEAINLFEDDLKHEEHIKAITIMKEEMMREIGQAKSMARSASFASWLNLIYRK